MYPNRRAACGISLLPSSHVGSVRTLLRLPVSISGIDLCDGPIPRPEESYRVCVPLSVTKRSNNQLHHTWPGSQLGDVL